MKYKQNIYKVIILNNNYKYISSLRDTQVSQYLMIRLRKTIHLTASYVQQKFQDGIEFLISKVLLQFFFKVSYLIW